MLWKTLEDNYPAFELVVGATGDSWLDDYTARLTNMDSVTDAYPILEELVDRFHDYHTQLHWPNKPPQHYPADVRLGWVENTVAVVAATVASTSLRPGDVLLTIDGRDVMQLYQEKLRVSRGATPFARRSWACDCLLEGAYETEVQVRVKRIDENTLSPKIIELNCLRTMKSPRDSLEFLRNTELSVDSRFEASDVGYIRIPSWQVESGEELLSRFDKAIEGFRKAPYLLIDVRDNRGGSDDLSDQITGRFLRSPIVSSVSFVREPGTNRYEKMVSISRPRGPWRYEGKVAVLINEDCASACGHFVNAMRASGDVRLVGRPTSGSCGWSKFIPLQGGLTLRCSLTLPLHGTQTSALNGIEPHLLVLPTLESLRCGQDLVIENAIALLRAETVAEN